jgi:hypothetical protein
MDQRQCICCRTRFIPLRNPDQRYCSKPVCQKKRQYRYKRQKLKMDVDYKHNQQRAQQRWCKKHPDYWKQYRLHHPGYAESNRLAQRVRNKNRIPKMQKEPVEVIAKITPLIQETPDLSMHYKLILLTFDMIAKRERYRQENISLVMSST